ncbi:hypothetical protein, partial [Actinoplanes sp. ATCC 53533]
MPAGLGGVAVSAVIVTVVVRCHVESPACSGGAAGTGADEGLFVVGDTALCGSAPTTTAVSHAIKWMSRYSTSSAMACGHDGGDVSDGDLALRAALAGDPAQPHLAYAGTRQSRTQRRLGPGREARR